MNFKKGFVALIVTVLFMGGSVFSGNVFAQQAEPAAPKKEEPAVNLKVGGILYMEFSSKLVSATRIAKSASNGNSFSLTRAYLTFNSTLGLPELTANVILDAGQVSSKSTTAAATYTSTGALMFIKNAYAQYSKGWFDSDKHGKAFTLTVRGGVIPTPNSNLVTGMSDLRWLGNEHSMDRSSRLITYKTTATASKALTLDTTADLGASVAFKIFKYAELTYAITNGESFATVKETYDGKSHYLMANFNPFMDLYVYGFFRDAALAGIDTTNASKHAHLQYFGGGVAWKSALIKVGISFINSVYGETAPHINKARYNTLEAWFNLNLAPITNYGFLIVGRMAWGNQYNRGDDENMMVCGGAGYEFNKYFRMMAYYEHYMYKEGWASPVYTPARTINKNFTEGTLYIKTEAKF